MRMSPARFAYSCLLFMPLLAAPAAAHGPNAPSHQTHCMGDLKLESGEAIKDFCISYVTHGTLNANKSNALLMVTAIGGNHHRIDYLIGPGRALDPAKYFIIATDVIGNGLSTSRLEQQGAAAHAVPEVQPARHGQLAAAAGRGEIRHQ